jgi:hypothetical protein
MNKKSLLYIIVGIVIGSMIVLYIYRKFESYTEEQFKGICLFDIDDTLTTGTENDKVVDECIKAGYAVGISTANPSYFPHTVRFFKWMPSNLYDFMEQHKFDTFNNVSSFYLNGKMNKDAYKEIDSYLPENINIYGWRKGFTLMSTASLYGITDTKKMILFDDNREYINGIKAFNGNVNVVCSGRDCGGTLNVETTLKVI